MIQPSDSDEHIQLAAEWIAHADVLLIALGAGMGVDSGLPTFRGTEGLWRAYPPLEKLQLDFAALAQPRWFAHNPSLAWGFYGHRLQQYRHTTPHIGFHILRDWCATRAYAVMTSNVDGQAQQAGFEHVWEIHGSIHTLQCTQPCCQTLWSADSHTPSINTETLTEKNALPLCPHCGHIARPNILMFNDTSWVAHESQMQERWHDAWLHNHAAKKRNIVIIECGAGTAIPSVRLHSEWVAAETPARLIRINTSEAQVPHHIGDGYIGLTGSAATVLRDIDNCLLAWG